MPSKAEQTFRTGTAGSKKTAMQSLQTPPSRQVPPPRYLSCLSASPCPWKKMNERMKSAMKMVTSEMTTAEVVDSPTPLAPPLVLAAEAAAAEGTAPAPG
ncbi:hypothetical protein TSOC_011807 [Tetrabaena socialis]|uniref:Uncharacterized protein n=1 Tax=Tetrabaena socialis TaxID=47790 RepID=A0A2J7ZPQ1_9CHLO|nr:hypothetical protein TSOC_011807 [Tetrabaena socialis]|eukprot:PNH02236.1 hypothetical protein TSOC_011807 [Tetrabaena socialis]